MAYMSTHGYTLRSLSMNCQASTSIHPTNTARIVARFHAYKLETNHDYPISPSYTRLSFASDLKTSASSSHSIHVDTSCPRYPTSSSPS
jgi:hypothetical protein